MLLLLVLPTCGDDAEVVTSAAPTGADQEYEASGTILESAEHGPELCAGVQHSYPPQCSGVPIVGWDWDGVEGEESANGTTWGDYRIVGAWDGTRLTLTQEPGPPRHPEAQERTDLTTPCPTPPGGWAVTDPSTATEGAQSEAIEHARRQPSFAGAWVDQSINPASKKEPMDEEAEMAMNDPTKLVLNFRFTEDLPRHREEIAEIWGGALCASEARHTLEELEHIRDEVEQEVADGGMEAVSSDVGEVDGVVSIGVTVADPAVQADLDERYGEGVVVLRGTLEPLN